MTCHTINFQNLKKFFQKVSYFGQSATHYNYSSNVDDSRVFGRAYHKILEQNPEIIAKLAKKSSSREIGKIIDGYNLTIHEQNLLLKMIQKIYQNEFYRNAICTAQYNHSEQNICHFMTKNQYVFRLEAIIDAVLSINNKRKVIIDYKTINSIKMVEKHIASNFYWMQLLFYRYIYQNSVKNNKNNSEEIFDLILFFQSKNPHDDYEIKVKKFSDLPKSTQREYEGVFFDGLEQYIAFFCKHGRIEQETKKKITKDHVFLERKKKFDLFAFLKTTLKITIKTSITTIIGIFLFLFEYAKKLPIDEKFFFILLIIFVVGSIWFIFKE